MLQQNNDANKCKCYVHKRGKKKKSLGRGHTMSSSAFQLQFRSLLLLFQLSFEMEEIELLNTSQQTKQLSTYLPKEARTSTVTVTTHPSQPDKSTKCWKGNKSVGLNQKCSEATNGPGTREKLVHCMTGHG